MTKIASAVQAQHPPGAVRLDIVDDLHFIMFFDRPGRVEVSAHGSDKDVTLIAHVYDGVTVDMEQEPLAAFDSTVGSQPWLSLKPGAIEGDEGMERDVPAANAVPFAAAAMADLQRSHDRLARMLMILTSHTVESGQRPTGEQVMAACDALEDSIPFVKEKRGWKISHAILRGLRSKLASAVS